MKHFVMPLSALVLTAATGAAAQVIPPLRIDGPAQAAMEQLHPPTALEQVREQAMRRSAPLPLPAPPVERWVPERHVHLPGLGREALIPGHYERRLSDQLYVVPPLPAYDLTGPGTVIIPGGERPPADLRQGP